MKLLRITAICIAIAILLAGCLYAAATVGIDESKCYDRVLQMRPDIPEENRVRLCMRNPDYIPPER